MAKYLFFLLVSVVAFAVYVVMPPREIDRKLVTAAGMGEVETLVALMNRGANIDARAVKTWTPLSAAADGGHVEVVKVLLSAGVDVDNVRGDGNSALFWAAFEGHIKIVRILLENGADPNVADHRGSGEFLKILRKRKLVAIEYLLCRYGLNVD